MITASLIESVRNDVKIALDEIAKKHGLALGPKMQATYESNLFYFTKITFVEGSLEDADKKTFDQYCEYYKLQKSDYLAKFAYRGEVLQLVGIATTRPKFPIKMRNVVTGQVLFYTRDVFKTHERITE
jgi:hypothetical protein